MHCGDGTMTDDVIRLREEIAEQIKCLKQMKEMAQSYGYDISRPAQNAKEAIQWLYFGYLAAIKTQMVQQCPLVVSALSWISILKEI